MRWSEQELYEVFVARDAGWDGRFVTGVVTTGIYCLPSCPARKPLPEYVRFSLEHRPDGREVERLLAPFAPHRSLATFQLWSQLGDPA